MFDMFVSKICFDKLAIFEFKHLQFKASNAARGSIGAGTGLGVIPSGSIGSGGMGSGTSSGNASAVCSRPGSASPPPYQVIFANVYTLAFKYNDC